MSSELFKKRRQRVLNRLGDGLLVLPTAPQRLRNGDVHHAFRHGSDFHYLTGFDEPDTVLAAYRVNAREHEAILFLRPRDREREVWDGARLGPRGAVEKLGVDEAYPIATLYEKLEAWLQKSERLFYTLGADELMDRSLARVFERNRAFDYRGNPAAHPVVQDPLPTIATARLIKDAVEIRALEDAARVSAAGHRRAMQTAAPGQMEFELQAEIEGAFRRLGSKRNGYESIVASGTNTCVLHYVSNERKMKRNDLVLVDATRPWGLPAPPRGGDPVRALIPRGLLRERPAALGRADAIVLTRCDQVAAAALDALAGEIERIAPGRPLVRARHRARGLRAPGGGVDHPAALAFGSLRAALFARLALASPGSGS